MISKNFIEQWGQFVRWKTLSMIEQDLIISKALICLFNNKEIKENLVFRGGTALNKIFLNPPARYSEDIDFVQKRAEPIGQTISAIRNALDNWLGEPKRKLTERSVKLIYQYLDVEDRPRKLKIEINTTEHFQVLDLIDKGYSINSEYFSGSCLINTYQLEELMATKLRALYQRRKGRDLFDIWLIFSKSLADVQLTIDIFKKYCVKGELNITRELFYENMKQKKAHKDFTIDMDILLDKENNWHFDTAFDFVHDNIIQKL